MKRSGFSLIEVNMAVFVLAIGVLSMAVLYPLGLRESMQSQADIKQSMFADFVLNVAVAAASSTNVTWSEWEQWANVYNTTGKDAGTDFSIDNQCVPHFVGNVLFPAIETVYNRSQLPGFKQTRNQTFAVYCMVAGGPFDAANPGPASNRIMGIMVRSLDMDTSNMSTREKIKRLEAQPIYYAEARFQGSP
jgi:hypothetical protein